MNTAKDPVCGMTVFRDQALSVTAGGRTLYVCSDHPATDGHMHSH